MELTVSKKRRDWFTIIRVHLAYAGVSQMKVASACHRDAKTVENWINGGEPKDADARTVLALYKRHCLDDYIRHMKEFQPDSVEEYPMPPPKPKKTREVQPDDDQMDLFKVVRP